MLKASKSIFEAVPFNRNLPRELRLVWLWKLRKRNARSLRISWWMTVSLVERTGQFRFVIDQVIRRSFKRWKDGKMTQTKRSKRAMLLSSVVTNTATNGSQSRRPMVNGVSCGQRFGSATDPLEAAMAFLHLLIVTICDQLWSYCYVIICDQIIWTMQYYFIICYRFLYHIRILSQFIQ